MTGTSVGSAAYSEQREAREAISPGQRYAFLKQVRERVGYALQPIVNIHTGVVYGYEALLRGVAQLGFPDVQTLFSYACGHRIAHSLDMTLRERAIGQFARLPNAGAFRLFLNMDPRIMDVDVERPEKTLDLLQRFGLGPDVICFELSEIADLTTNPHLGRIISAYRAHRFQIAIDDFGTGYSGLKLLYEHPPELLKIDRFFIQRIADDYKKRLFVANTVQLAHVMGISVVAEGVETERELMTCKEVGCDLVQGFLIARPTLQVEELRHRYEDVAEINRRSRRAPPNDKALVQRCLEVIPPICIDDGIKSLFEAFRHTGHHHVLPAVDAVGRPVGVIHEADIKELIYSGYGRDLITNRAYGRSLRDFVRPCPVVDVESSPERLLEAYSSADSPAGLILVDDFRYLGFVSATSLIRLIDEKNLAAARDQNPLSKLPGNTIIHEYVSNALEDRRSTWHLVYLDFDNFKAFNDLYGFRRGDRAILMFAELLRKELSAQRWFVGHVGGDDFFVGIQDADPGEVMDQVACLLAQFRIDVQSLYEPDDRMRGWITAADRWGEVRNFPLMTCSAAILPVRPEDDYGCVEDLGRAIATMKKEAKASETGIVLGEWCRDESCGPRRPAQGPAPRLEATDGWALGVLADERETGARRMLPAPANAEGCAVA